MKQGFADAYDVVIVGAGLGGLLCANILSREGYKVCVLEKNSRIGGSIQSFSRNGVVFNTGLNFTESLGEGETLNRYFKFFGIFEKLKIRQMDTNAFERISFNDDPMNYPFAQGQENFIEQLAQYFPQERENLTRYVELLEKVCNSFPLYSLNGFSGETNRMQYLSMSAHDVLKEATPNVKLQNVLAGINSLYAGVADTTPFYVHALINYSFMKSSWRLVDGSSQLTFQIARTIKEAGGQIFRHAEVQSFGGEAKAIEYVQLTNGVKIHAKHFISNLHPSVTINMVQDSLSKRGYKNRINSMHNTIGMFTLYVNFKKDSFPYLNYNQHHFAHDNAWTTDYDIKEWPCHYMFYTPAVSTSEQWAESAIVITYMRWEEVSQWAHTSVGKRGEAYRVFKQDKANLLIEAVEQRMPGFKDSIDTYCASTPLTYQNYTGTPNGSAYGILKNWKDPLATLISPRSRVPNLLYTGQNLNMHGILGVSIGAFSTCAELLGYEYLVNKLKAH